MVLIGGATVDVAGAKKAVAGGWSKWKKGKVPCSVTCGKGYRLDTRRCNRPKARNGGKACPGPNTMVTWCLLPRCEGRLSHSRPAIPMHSTGS